MHAGSTKRHNWVAQNVVFALRARLATETWSIGFADVAVAIGADIRYPDVLVERLEGDGRELASEAPVLIVDVLSPSSIGTDMTAKLAEYTSLASLEAYIVASQDEVIAWVWMRDGERRAFPSTPKEIAGRQSAMEIAALGLTLPMDELYRGIKI